jgi:hypothetical protein
VTNNSLLHGFDEPPEGGMSPFARFLATKAMDGIRAHPIEKIRTRKLIEDGIFDFEFIDLDGDLTTCSADDVLDTFFKQGYVNFNFMIYGPALDPSVSNTITNFEQVSDLEKDAENERLRILQDEERRNPSGMLGKTVIQTSMSNSSVGTGYRAGQEPQTILQKNQTMTDKSKRIYGYTLHATPLLGKIDKKGLMKDPPVNLTTETESITFLQGFHNHCQSHGVYVCSSPWRN